MTRILNPHNMNKSTLKQIAFALLFAGTAAIAHAQWTELSAPAINYPANDVKSFNGSLYAATNQGVFRSNDDGATWTDLTQGYATSSSSSYLELFFGGGNIFARTSTQGVLKSTSGETNWAHDTANIGLCDVKAMYYDATSGKLFIGLTWPIYGMYTKLPSDPAWTQITNSLFGSNFTPAQITRKGGKLFVIDGVSRIFESTDDGVNWVQKTGTSLPQTGASDAASKFLGIGNDLFLANSGVWKSADDGDTWTRIDTGFAYSFGTYVDTRSLYYDGTTLYSGIIGGKTYSSPDLGNSWYYMGAAQSFIKSMVRHNNVLFGAAHASDSVYVYNGVSAIAEQDISADVRLYPNPAGDQLSVDNIDDGAELDVFDVSGKLVYSALSRGGRPRISTSEFCNGVYWLRIRSEGAVAHKKFVVSR